jgi:DNA primase
MSVLFPRVQDEFDWEEYVRDHFTVKNTPSDELRICCFMCGESEYKLYVNPVKRKFNCFKCSFSSGKYDTFDFVAKAEAIPRHRAVKRLLQEYARTTPDDPMFAIKQRTEESQTEAITEPTPIKTIAGLPPGSLLLMARTEVSAPFWDYLIDRGLTEREIRAVRFHYIPAASCVIYDSRNKRRGDVGRRVVVPIYGGDNQLVSWQCRVVDPTYAGHDKYLTAPESELAKTLWPYVPPYGTHAVLVEGVLDALAVRRIPNVSAYATFTKKISLEQILRLKAWGVSEVTIFWDKRDAKREIIRAVPELHMHFRKVYVCRMQDWPANKDAGNMLAETDGTDKLKLALEDRVDTYDTLEYSRWQLTFGESSL